MAVERTEQIRISVEHCEPGACLVEFTGEPIDWTSAGLEKFEAGLLADGWVRSGGGSDKEFDRTIYTRKVSVDDGPAQSAYVLEYEAIQVIGPNSPHSPEGWVALSGEIAVSGLGRYVYKRIGDSWEFGGLASAEKSTSLALWGKTLVLGLPRKDGGRGEALVVELDWSSPEKTLTASPRTEAKFGEQVAVWQDMIAVGTETTRTEFAAVHVFKRSAESWELERVISGGEKCGDARGSCFVISDGWLAFSCDSGPIVMFRRGQGDWIETQVLAEPVYSGCLLAMRAGRLLVINLAGENRDASAVTYDLRDRAWEMSGRLDLPVRSSRRFSCALDDGVAVVGESGSLRWFRARLCVFSGPWRMVSGGDDPAAQSRHP